MERLYRPTDHTPTLFDRERVTEPERLRERFERFHADNPHAYDELVRRARLLIEAGTTHYSIRGLFEAMRFDHALDTTGDDFKLNNNLTSHYARLLMEQEDDLQGFFHLREQRV